MKSRSRIIDGAEVTSERISVFRHHWSDLRGGRDVPLRERFDPLEVPRLLPFLALTEIEALPLRVRYRLVGTQLVESNGFDFTGCYLDECGFAVEALLTQCYQRLVATRAPVFAYYEWHKVDLQGPVGKVGASQTGFFPFSTDGWTIDRAIGIADFDVAPYPSDRGGG